LNNQQGNFSNPYNNTHNFSQDWKNQRTQYGWKQETSPSQGQQYPSLYDKTNNFKDTLDKFIQSSMSNQKNTKASIKNLETQVG